MYLQGVQVILRTGSAAMNLAYVSDGKFGAAIGETNKPWDIAAGIILAESAGAKVKCQVVDKENNLGDYVVAKPSIFETILDIVD